MKAAKIVLVVVFAAALIQSAKLGYRYFLPEVIPCCHGSDVTIYDIVGIVFIALFIYLFVHIGRRGGRSKGYRRLDSRYRQHKSDTYDYNRRYR